eukprot:Protomagalhaensia_wolfi_Nauph_80__4506@NODE_4622_length_536_cov_3_599598_g3712_i0_p1_GENE_NODE_4622_length_536_cov_3_599598_g3712_i0NODE_4622_length_536_cov_3_599598_g3712_i0_p1_ORF_typecomplete_len155_score29_37Adenyl_cycl_N/PF12633_7/2_9e03Adenyl_cycl_N/PF12633_7/0_041_NODE_4622_length_536_cov_3_599598_g3712_i049513
MDSGFSEQEFQDVTTLLQLLHSEVPTSSALESRFWDRTVEGSYPEQVTTGWDENYSTDSNLGEPAKSASPVASDNQKLQDIAVLIERAERDLEISKSDLMQTIKQYIHLIEPEIPCSISEEDICGVVEYCQSAFNPDLVEDWEKNYGVNQKTVG